MLRQNNPLFDESYFSIDILGKGEATAKGYNKEIIIKMRLVGDVSGYKIA